MEVRLFFLTYSILFATVFFAADVNADLTHTDMKMTNLRVVSQFQDSADQLLIKESDSDTSNFFEINELQEIPAPFSQELKNKNSVLFRLQFIISLIRQNSLLCINNLVVSAKVNISPLSGILQI